MQEISTAKYRAKYRMVPLVLLAGILTISLATRSTWVNAAIRKIRGESPVGNTNTLVKSVSAQEIYPMFECPCCGKPIDQCTCPMAVERRAFVDGLTSAEISKEGAVEAYAKKYGLESFIDDAEKEKFREKLVQEAPSDRPIINVSPLSYNFGDVSQLEGTANTSVEIKSDGKKNLIINQLESSCGCTTASIVYQGKEGPRFSMPGHGDNEAIGYWQVAIPPGETAQLKIYYDPNVHADFRGTAIRTVSVFSNDPIDFEKKVQIELNQVD